MSASKIKRLCTAMQNAWNPNISPWSDWCAPTEKMRKFRRIRPERVSKISFANNLCTLNIACTSLAHRFRGRRREIYNFKVKVGPQPTKFQKCFSLNYAEYSVWAFFDFVLHFAPCRCALLVFRCSLIKHHEFIIRLYDMQLNTLEFKMINKTSSSDVFIWLCGACF